MSDIDDKLAAWRLRLALVRQALKKSAPTGGGGAPADTPVKPPDARGAVDLTATPGAVLPAAAPDEVKQFRGSCKARCANTGLLCRLPAHSANVPHRSERGAFYQVAVEGQTTFPRREELDRAARRAPEEEASHVRS